MKNSKAQTTDIQTTQPKALQSTQTAEEVALAAKVAKALEGMTPEQAAEELARDAAALSQAAQKAHATRKANGTSSHSAKSAWITRRAIKAAKQALAAKAGKIKVA